MSRPSPVATLDWAEEPRAISLTAAETYYLAYIIFSLYAGHTWSRMEAHHPEINVVWDKVRYAAGESAGYDIAPKAKLA